MPSRHLLHGNLSEKTRTVTGKYQSKERCNKTTQHVIYITNNDQDVKIMYGTKIYFILVESLVYLQRLFIRRGVSIHPL